MTEDQAEDLIRSLGLSGYAANLQRSLVTTTELKLYRVINTANATQFVLASGPAVARALSCSSNHIKDHRNGICQILSEDFFNKNAGFGSAVKRAVSNGKQGVVERKRNHAVRPNLNH